MFFLYLLWKFVVFSINTLYFFKPKNFKRCLLSIFFFFIRLNVTDPPAVLKGISMHNYCQWTRGPIFKQLTPHTLSGNKIPRYTSDSGVRRNGEKGCLWLSKSWPGFVPWIVEVIDLATFLMSTNKTIGKRGKGKGSEVWNQTIVMT